MAQAPKIDSPQVMPSGQPLRPFSIQTNPDMFGAGIGRAVANLGGTLTEVAGAMQTNGEKLRLQSAKTSANQAYVNASLAANELEAGYLSTMGEDAPREYKGYLESLATIRQEALDSLEDDDAKQLFDEQFQTPFLSGADSGAKHAAGQGRQAAVDSSQARVDLIMADSSTKFDDEDLFQRNLMALDQQLIEQRDLMGWSDEVLVGKSHQLRSLAWESRITSMAASDPMGAQKQFNRVRDDLTVESRLRIQNNVVTNLRSQAADMGKQNMMQGANAAVRPTFREGIIQGGRNEQADSFLVTRLNSGKGADSVKGMVPQFANNLAGLIESAPPGIRENLTIVSGFRSEQRQAELFQAAVQKYGSVAAARKWVAPPGRSQHNHGNAADLGWKGGGLQSAPPEVTKWLHDNAGQFGLNFRMAHEPWHIELSNGTQEVRGADGSLVDRIRAAEGGGAGVSSSAGAWGIMQIMPGTGAMVANSLGIPFDPHRLKYDDNYNMLLGTTYLNMMLERYGGNEFMAAAAYNAGPGAVDKWVTQFGDPNKGQISNEEWASMIPFGETRNYVAKVMGATGTAPPRTPVNAMMSPQEFQQREADGYAWAEMVMPGDRTFAENYVQGMRQEYNDMVAQNKAQVAALYDNMVETVITPGEDGKYMNQAQFNAAMEADPDLADAWAQLSGVNKKTIQDQLSANDTKNNKGATVITDDQLAEYDRLHGMWLTDPEAFKNEDIAANPRLSQAMKKEAIGWKGKKPPGSNAQGSMPDINMNTAMSLAGPSLAALKIDKKKDPEQWNQFYGALARNLSEQATALGRKLTQPEQLEIIRQLLLKQTTTGPGFWTGVTLFGDWSPFGDVSQEVFNFEADRPVVFPGMEPAATLTPSVPARARERIVEQYTAQYGKPPTDQIINQIYFTKRKKQAGGTP